MNITQAEISDAVAQLIYQSTPIIFLDTCAILDIARLPFREKNPTTAKSYLESAQKVLQLVSEKKLQLIIPPNVSIEYKDNLQTTKDELSRYLKEVGQSLEILEALHLLNNSGFSAPNVTSLGTESFLEGVCENIISSAIHIAQDSNLIIKATDRAVKNTPPSRKGAVKDCIIYEHCLQISSLLRNKGYKKNIVFLTSNRKDYCDNKGRTKQHISNELSLLKIHLCLDWTWAFRNLI